MKAVALLAACTLLLFAAQDPPVPAVYTVAQAQAGRTLYLSTCGKCHTASLTGRSGAAGELPLLTSLNTEMQKTVADAGGIVPPLIGPKFMGKWPTTRELENRINEAVGGFPPEGRRNPETYLRLTAYILQANGAQSGPRELTGATVVELNQLGLR
jgi:hypothetical protein